MANVVNENMYNQLVKLYGGDTAKADKYKASIENTYSTDKYNQLVNNLNKLYGSSSSTPTTTTTKTNTVSQASNGISQASLDANRNNAKAGTGYVAPIPEKSIADSYKPDSDTLERLGKSWNSLSYGEQQKRLNTISGLKDELAKRGITSKTQPDETTIKTTTPTKTTTKATPQQQQWDYQDNSQARKDQILDHLNNYRVTNPELFEDASMFYNFFIDGNGRSQEQIDLLWDYFNRVQKYGKYDNLPASSIGDMLVNGKLPEDYLNYLKSTDPQKYQEALSYRQDAEDTVKYESYLSDIADQAGLGGFESFYKGIYGYKDENNDNIDDGLYVAPTEEEQTKQNRVNTIDSRIMEIKNMQKNLLDDLTEQYPGVPKATLMGIVQDRTKDLQREYDDLMVERTGLVGNIEYMQNERDMQMDARQKTINNLKTAYGMYYDYTAEGMAEMAQNKYAATNITLDQADQGTETQKQMALEAAITPIFEQYGDIIQRSPAQVINDTIAYAKKNGIGLRQALEENFMKPLREKPAYQSMQSQMNATGLKREKVGKDANGNDIYGFVDLSNKTVSPYGTMGGGVSSATANTYTVEEVSSNRDKRVSAMRDIANQYDNLGDMAEGIAYNMEGVGGGNLECGQYVNDYINAVTGSKGQYGNSISQKSALASNKNWDDIQVGDAIVFDYNINTPQWVLNSPQKEELLKYGHVGFVTGINPDGSINMSHTNGGVVQNTVVKPGSSFYNSFAGSQHINKSQSLGKGFNEQLTNEYLAFIQAAGKPADQKKIAEGLGLSVEEMREQSNKYSWQQTGDTYFDMLGRINNILSLAESGDLPSFMTRKNAQSEGFFGGRSTLSPDVSDWKADNDKIVDTLSLDSLINLKGRGATFGALSDSEREAIGRYATALGSPMSDAKYINELKQLRAKLIESSHGYLGDLTSYGQNQSYTGNQSYDWTAGI